MENKVKSLGQVYTPKSIVSRLLDIIDYSGSKILQKHVIDNSCGDGAILVQVVERYICEFKKAHKTLKGVEGELEKFVHGIEIDTDAYLKCLNRLDDVAAQYDLLRINFNIINGDALTIDNFCKKMDYVIGNPPYVRTHNLQDSVVRARDFKFSNSGMRDLFIVFYEIGFNMLSKNGKLCYITPNSFYSSLAGKKLREYVIAQKHLYAVFDLGHYTPFKVSTYTTIFAFDKCKNFDIIQFSKFDSNGKIAYSKEINWSDLICNGEFVFSDDKGQEFVKRIKNYVLQNPKKIEVKNGFATLADDVFIKEEFKLADEDSVIKVIKASTGEIKECLYPYDDAGKLKNFDHLSKAVQDHFEQNKTRLKNRSLDKNAEWFAFGRSQAINDVFKDKISLNNTIRDVQTIKIHEAPRGVGVYSGVYIVGEITKQQVEKYLKSEEFIKYVSAIGKCRSGGYYTFSTKDVKQFLLYKMENEKNG